MTNPIPSQDAAGQQEPLKPCPFCGGAPVARTSMGESMWTHDIVKWTTIECGGCKAETNATCEGFEMEAPQLWNRRTTTAGIPLEGVQAHATFVDQIDADRAAMEWLVSLVPESRHQVFWSFEQKNFAQPSEGGKAILLSCNSRPQAAAIVIRDDLNRSLLIRWQSPSPPTYPESCAPSAAASTPQAQQAKDVGEPPEAWMSQLQRFLDAAAGEGLVLADIDAADLYITYFGNNPPPKASSPEASPPVAPTVEAAHAMGASGSPPVEAERLAFEAYMRGHCWALGATWTGTQYLGTAESPGYVCPIAMGTRRLWAVWRDRAALSTPPAEPISRAFDELVAETEADPVRGPLLRETRERIRREGLGKITVVDLDWEFAPTEALPARILDAAAVYWGCAFKEGQEGRTHDTPSGDAAAAWEELQQAIREFALYATPQLPVLSDAQIHRLFFQFKSVGLPADDRAVEVVTRVVRAVLAAAVKP